MAISGKPLTDLTILKNIEAPEINKINMGGYYDKEHPEIANQIDEALDQTKKYADALEERYKNPNWFKVAAGLAKPQLGGFMASLGSGAEALGDWQEQQRAVAPTIAKMRAQTNIYGANLAQQAVIERKMQNWTKEHPGEPYPSELIAESIKLTGPESAQSKGATNFLTKALEAQTGSLQLADAIRIQAETRLKNGIDPTQYLRDSGVPEKMIQAFLSSMPKTNLGGGNTAPVTGATSAVPGAPTPKPVVDQNALAENDKKVADLNKRIQSGTYGPEEKAELNKLKAERAQIMGGTGGAPASPSSGYYPSSFTPSSNLTMSQQQNLSNADVENTAKLIDANGQAEYSKASQFNKYGQNYTNAMADTQAALDAISTNKKSFVDVTDIVRRAGPLAAASAKGFGIHVGPYGVNISLPVEAYEGAKLNSEQRAYADMILDKIASSNYYSMIANGMDPKSEDFQEKLIKSVLTNKSPVAIRHTLETNREIFKHNAEVFDIFQKELSKTNPNSLTKLTDILHNSKELDDAKKRHLAVRTELSKRSFGSVQ